MKYNNIEKIFYQTNPEIKVKEIDLIKTIEAFETKKSIGQLLNELNKAAYNLTKK